MDITNTEIIEDALREINVIGQSDSASAEQGQHALRQLNGMLEMWTEDGIELGYFEQTATTDTCPIPDWAVFGIKTALAVALAPQYGATVGPALATKVTKAVNTIYRKALNERIKKADMRHQPQGERRYGYDIETDTYS